MLSIGDMIDGIPSKKPSSYEEPRRYRGNAIFANERECRCRLDRNQRAKIMHIAEALEARTKPRGRQNGVISRIGLIVLRCFLFSYLGPTGRCDPSYSTIGRKTGLCRYSISRALGRLERCGLVKIIRRLVRKRIWRMSPWTGAPEEIIATLQTSNSYVIATPFNGVDMLAPPGTERRAMPERRQFGFSLPIEPSLGRRQKPTTDLYTLMFNSLSTLPQE